MSKGRKPKDVRKWDHKTWKAYLEMQGIELSGTNYPRILVEGPDGAGKSTLIETLMEIMKHTFLLHTSAPVNGSDSSYYPKVLASALPLIETLEQPFIADRFHVGESVYGEIYRWTDLDVRAFEAEHALFQLGNVKQIYVTASTEVLLERLNKRGDWYIDPGDVIDISRLYEERLADSDIPTFVYDNSEGMTAEKVVELLRFIYDM